MALRPSNKTVVTEEIDPKTGHIIRRTVTTPMHGPRRRTLSLSQQFIDRITQLVQNLEIEYHFGNNVIECLKNYKLNPRVKKRKPRFFIPNKTQLTAMFNKKYNNPPPVPNEVLEKEIGVLEEILHQIDTLGLEQHWRSKLVEKHEVLTNQKNYQERQK